MLRVGARRIAAGLPLRVPAALPAAAQLRPYGKAWSDAGSNEQDVSHWEKVRIVRKKGVDLIHDPIFNKGTAFSTAERDRLEIRGLLPPTHLDLETQSNRILEEFRHGIDYIYDDEKMKKSGVTREMVRKWIMMQNLQDRNETLFYKLVMENFTEMLNIIYTPTVGFACQFYGALFRRPRGMYFSKYDVTEMAPIAYNWPARDVDAIVVTDGSRILGLGDLGVQGIGISIGKLDLYVGAGGFHPGRVLPVVIDVGTNNKVLREQQYYMGLKEPRLEGDKYIALMDEFMEAMYHRYPKALIQFEDFENKHARKLLERYRERYLVFNDDIQGTACSALAGLYGALAVQGLENKDIVHQRFVVAGAGSAGLGVATMIRDGIVRQGGGKISLEDAAKAIWVVDKDGLVTHKRGGDLTEAMQPLARADEDLEGMSLVDVVKKSQATAIVGLSGQGGLFTRAVLQALAGVRGTHRPIVFPMSNPTISSECTFKEAVEYTNGRCVFGSGSPYEPIQHKGTTWAPSQANNSYIFPGLALGARVGEAKRVTDGMLMAAAEALNDLLSEEDKEGGMCFPPLDNIRDISKHIATMVIMQGAKDGVLKNKALKDTLERKGYDGVKSYVSDRMYVPVYEPLVYLQPGVEE